MIDENNGKVAVAGEGNMKILKSNGKSLVEGEFSFLYDTQQLAKNMWVMDPDKVIVASVKIHGTSVIVSKLHVKNPLPLRWDKKIWNKLIDLFNGSEKFKFKYDYTVDYGPIFSSRTVIKNRYINEEVTAGYYSQDVWTEFGEMIYPYLENGISVYGEIYGYLTGTSSMIQKQYAYDCKEGENKLMPYRITRMNEDGTKTEFNVVDVYEGAYMHSRGVFRSEATSCMNDNIAYYNAISREAMVKRIMKYSGESYSFEEFKANDKESLPETSAIATRAWDGVSVGSSSQFSQREPKFMGEKPSFDINKF
jgi:hypothetical protein